MQKRNFLKFRIHAAALFPVALLFSAATLAAIETEAPLPAPPAASGDGEPIEEIEVLGQRSLLSFRFEIYRAEDRMYGMFNDLNSSDALDVNCEDRLLPGSHIRHRSCSRRYMEDAQAENASAAMRGYEPMKSPITLWNENRTNNEQFSAEVTTLMEQNPEFVAAIADVVEKRERYADERRHRVQNTFIGRLLSGVQD